MVLQCGSNEGPLQLSSIPAKMAQLYLVDLLYNEFIRRDMDAPGPARSVLPRPWRRNTCKIRSEGAEC